MKITFHGAAQTVTGSKHLVETDNGTKILLDCGLFQGQGSATNAMNEDFGFNPSEVEYLVLSHAHIDHSGLIPRLVAQGFKGDIICTPATFALSKILLLDSAKIQENDIRYTNKRREKEGKPLFEPLYTTKHAMTAFTYFKKVKYGVVYHLFDGVTVSFEDAGQL
jgi:metallo-beta-lactamase family protein